MGGSTVASVCVSQDQVSTAVMTKLKKIIDTVHTAGTLSVSMYRHFTQPSDGIPQVKHKDLKAFCLHLQKPHQQKYQDKSNYQENGRMFYQRF